MFLWKYLLFILFFITSQLQAQEKCVMISIIEYGTVKDQKECPKIFLDQKYSSGSLFKIFILGIANYLQIIDLKKNLENIRKKTYNSDNEYFVQLVKRIGKKNFIELANDLFYGTYFLIQLEEKNFKDDFSFVHGGNLEFYPLEIHRWFIEFAIEKRDFMKNIHSAFYVEEDNIKFYGKSGTWNGAAWYCGYRIEKQKVIIISVLIPYEKNQWKNAKVQAKKTFKEYISRFSEK